MNKTIGYILKIFIVILVILLSYEGKCQKIDKETYEIEKEKLGYDKTKTVWRPKTFEEEKKERKQNIPDVSFDGAISFLGYGLLLGILVFIIYSLKGNRLDSKISKERKIDLDQIENIKEVDLASMLTEAIVDGDMRLAIRIHYLLVIQAFTNKEVLDWKPHKTNRTYVAEMNGHPLQASFKEVSDIFDFVWYGVTDVSDQNYETIQSQFSSLLNKINNEGEQ